MKQGNEIPTIDVVLVTISPNDGSGEIGLKTGSSIQVNPQVETVDSTKLIVKGVLIAQKPSQTTITGNTIVLRDNVFNPEVALILQGGTINYAKVYTHSVTGSLSAGEKGIKVHNGYIVFTAEAMTSGDSIVFDESNGSLLATVGGEDSQLEYTYATEFTGDELTTTSTNTETIIGYKPPVAGSGDKGKVSTLNAYSAVYDAAGIITKYEKISYPNCQGTPIALSSEDGVFRAPEYTINSAPKSGEAPYEIAYVYDLPKFTQQ